MGRGEYSIEESLWPCEIDEGQIGQVIQNMVIYADQAMPEGGTIKICTENVMIDQKSPLPLEAGRYVKISITDQGIGISGKYLHKIFDPWIRSCPNSGSTGSSVWCRSHTRSRI